MIKSITRKQFIRILIALIFILSSIVFLLREPWKKYHNHGPLEPSPELYTQTGSSNVPIGEGFFFGGIVLQNDTAYPVNVLSIAPTNQPQNVTMKVLGVSTKQGVGAVNLQYFNESKAQFDIHKLPIQIAPHSALCKPVIELTPQKSGRFIVQGLIVTYRWKHRLYRDYFRDQFTLYSGSSYSKRKTPPLPPKTWKYAK